jgi:hypothetical protein
MEFTIPSYMRRIRNIKLAFGRTGFSLWGFDLASTKPHRLKPVPLALDKSVQPKQSGRSGSSRAFRYSIKDNKNE